MSTHPPPAPPSASPPPKVLIVEDSEFVHQIYRVAFRKLGRFELTHVNDGVAGLKALDQSGPVDLIIVDLNMPKMDGLTFLREVRNRPAHAATRVLFCSTEGRDGPVRRQIDELAQAYLCKPFSLDQIVEKLTEMFANAAERRAN